MASARLFHNYSDLDFTEKDGARWDGVGYIVKAGEKMMLQDFIAVHFADHLTMREMNRANNQVLINRESAHFLKLREKALPSDEVVEAESPEKLEMAIARPFCDSCDSKGGRHKKDCPKSNKVVEEEFPDLKESKK